MDRKRIHRALSVALPLLGSAILLLSCGGGKGTDEEENLEKVMTHQADTLTIFQSKNGKIKYKSYAPLMERYEYARQPYMEFRRGVEITTFNDSTMTVESTLKADYALYLEKQELWEARGNVVATNAQGQVLETQQLFWNKKTQRIYSNIDSKVTDGGSVYVGERFESDQDLKNWKIYRPEISAEVDVETGRQKNAVKSSGAGADDTGETSDGTEAAVSGNESGGREERIGNSGGAGPQDTNGEAGTGGGNGTAPRDAGGDAGADGNNR